MAGILEAIRKGFGVATKNLGLVLVLFIVNLIFNLISIPLAVKPGTQVPPQLTIPVLIFSIVSILVSIFVQGGSLALVKDYIKEGKMRLVGFASYGLKYYLRLLSLGLLIILIIGITALIAGLLVAVTTPLNNAVITNIAVAIAVIIVLIIGLLYFIPLALSPYALVCDEVGVIEAMKRSLKVGKNPLSRIFLILLLLVLLVLISLGIGFVVGFLVGLINAVVPANAGQILMGIATSLINGYLGVVMIAAFMTFYLALVSKTKTSSVNQ